MKKNNLFKAVGLVILFLVLLSWIVPIVYSIGGFKGDVSNQIGFVALINAILETFSGFGSLVLYVLMVGGFYGVLKVTGAYDKVLESLHSMTVGKEKMSLITMIVVLALISSISGLDFGLFVLFPLLIVLVVKMGYDKLVALSATVGATLVGMYGATFAGTLYGANNSILSVGKYDQMLSKVIFLVLGVAALITFVLLYIKKNGVSSKSEKVSHSSKKSIKKDERKGKKSSEKVSKAKKGDRTSVLTMLILGCVVLIMFLGTTNWEGIFKTNWFESAHTSWTGFKISKFAILDKLFGGVDAFGTWLTPTRFQTYSLLLVIAIVMLKFASKTKWSEVFDGFVDGIKSYILPTISVILACSVFVLVYYNPFLSVVTESLLTATKSFNVALAGIYTMINSFFYVDYYYLAYSVLYSITGVYSDKSVLSIISVMFANLYSLVMLISPTSVLLLASLAISDVKYTDWVKFIWKLVLALFVISFIVFTVMLVA